MSGLIFKALLLLRVSYRAQDILLVYENDKFYSSSVIHFMSNIRKGSFPVINLKQRQQTYILAMQNNFFNSKNNNLNSPKLLQFQLSNKQTPIIPPLEEDEYSNNVLNIGFIADSKFYISDSQSVASDAFSISGVSVIRPNPEGSPHLMSSFNQQVSSFSCMDEWSQSSQISFSKKNFKRNKPQTIEDECDEFQNRFTKKKLSDRNKVMSFSQHTKERQQSGYMLRSKSKQNVVQEESSSNEDIREILVNMSKQEKAPTSSQEKINQKR